MFASWLHIREIYDYIQRSPKTKFLLLLIGYLIKQEFDPWSTNFKRTKYIYLSLDNFFKLCII